LLGLDFRDNTTQKSSAVMITADATMIVDITEDTIITDNVDVVNNSYV